MSRHDHAVALAAGVGGAVIVAPFLVAALVIGERWQVKRACARREMAA